MLLRPLHGRMRDYDAYSDYTRDNVFPWQCSKDSGDSITPFMNSPLALCLHSSIRELATGKTRPQSKLKKLVFE